MKSWFKSWTIRFNTATAVAIAFAEFAVPQLSASLPMMREFVPPEMYGKLFLGVAVVNILLRFRTTQAVTLRDPRQG